MQAYLDNSATTRPAPAVVEAMALCMREGYFNPSSVYRPALAADKALHACREAVAARLGARAARVIFTSGGTEADNLAVLGLKTGRAPGRALYSAGEHPAVAESCRELARQGWDVREIPYTREGLCDLAALEALLTDDTRLICVMQVNNETGAIQPLAQIAALRDALCPGALLHVDGVQGFLRVPLHMARTGVDSYALSAHKIHGPKGVGALVLGERAHLTPRLFGGGQQEALRPGTENTPGVAGLLAAVEGYRAQNDMAACKALLWRLIEREIPAARRNGPPVDSERAAAHILNVSFPPVRAETLLHALEGEGVYVGMGAACSSRKQRVSPTLKAMGLPGEMAGAALRFSLCPDTTREEIAYAAAALARHYAVLSKFTRR